MNTIRLACCTLALLIGSASANPKAKDQLNTANQGAKQADHVFDGRKAQPAPVKADPGPKPSPVGQKVSDYKPAPTVQHKTPPPPPPPKPTAPAKKK